MKAGRRSKKDSIDRPTGKILYHLATLGRGRGVVQETEIPNIRNLRAKNMAALPPSCCSLCCLSKGWVGSTETRRGNLHGYYLLV
eukprot:scaffold6647_cov166-Amphora_coffeaeformis.AAC.3